MIFAMKILVVAVLVVIIFFSIEIEHMLGATTIASTTALQDTSQGQEIIPLLHQIAPLLFSMNPETNKIIFAPSIDTVVIDVGARLPNGYLRALESGKHNTTGLIVVDAQRDSIIPLQQRIANFNMQESNDLGWTLKPWHQHRVYSVHAAMSTEESTANFNIGTGPACSSLLKESRGNKFWCANQKGTERVMVFTVEDLVALIPDHLNVHLKVDTEGADLFVLKGAGDAIHRFVTIIIECNSDEASKNETYHEGECVEANAMKFMCMEKGMCHGKSKGQGSLVNIMWTRKEGIATPFLLAADEFGFYKGLP